jgi:hypothetical protein
VCLLRHGLFIASSCISLAWRCTSINSGSCAGEQVASTRAAARDIGHRYSTSARHWPETASALSLNTARVLSEQVLGQIMTPRRTHADSAARHDRLWIGTLCLPMDIATRLAACGACVRQRMSLPPWWCPVQIGGDAAIACCTVGQRTSARAGHW